MELPIKIQLLNELASVYNSAGGFSLAKAWVENYQPAEKREYLERVMTLLFEENLHNRRRFGLQKADITELIDSVKDEPNPRAAA